MLLYFVTTPTIEHSCLSQHSLITHIQSNKSAVAGTISKLYEANLAFFRCSDCCLNVKVVVG